MRLRPRVRVKVRVRAGRHFVSVRFDSFQFLSKAELNLTPTDKSEWGGVSVGADLRLCLKKRIPTRQWTDHFTLSPTRQLRLRTASDSLSDQYTLPSLPLSFFFSPSYHRCVIVVLSIVIALCGLVLFDLNVEVRRALGDGFGIGLTVWALCADHVLRNTDQHETDTELNANTKQNHTIKIRYTPYKKT